MSVETTPVDLSNEEVQRYARHLILPQVGMEGQKKLKQASILLIGAGGLGSPLSMYLAAAGIGRLGLVDFDVVDSSNLQRQIAHGTNDVGRKKTESAKETILSINPHTQVDTYETMLTSENAMEIAKDYDIIIDGTDNFPTRYLVNDISVFLGKVNVYGSIYRFDGQATVFDAKQGPCYRCLYPDPPPPGMVPSCAEGGVLGILPGLVGVVQATEAIKVILGEGDPLIGRLLTIDTMGMNFKTLKIRKDPNCPVCSENPTITEPIDYEMFCGVSTINDTQPKAEDAEIQMSVTELAERLKNGSVNLIDVRQPNEWDIANIPDAKLIPLDTLNERITELDSSKEYVVMCRSGVRSMKAITYLQEMGFTKLRNVDGGILAWADEIDPEMAKY